ncbi:MAG: radical SAM protein [Candidatus Hodarchaeales archaeon]|jgi:biotin synthase
MTREAKYPDVSNIRVSLGSAIELGLIVGSLDANLTTIYLLTATSCKANCSFCTQAKGRGKGRLSRVSWPVFALDDVIEAIESTNTINRVCLQVTKHSEAFEESLYLVSSIKNKTDLSVSLSCPPFELQRYKILKQAGVGMVGISFDAATPDIFDTIKGMGVLGPYRWESHMSALMDAIEVFGKWNAWCHLIVGLGETEKEATELIDSIYNHGALTSLFAFTPLRGTPLEDRKPPELASYRRLQVARYLINKGLARAVDFSFTADGVITDFGLDRSHLIEILGDGHAFLTSGCPDCNRPYYNDSPLKRRSGELYNFPGALKPVHLQKIVGTMFKMGD